MTGTGIRIATAIAGSLALTAAVTAEVVVEIDVLVVVLAVAGAVAVTGAVTGRPWEAPATPARRWRARVGWWSAGSVVFLAVAATATVLVLGWLLGEADRAGGDARAAIRIDAIRTGLTVAGGLGALALLGLAVRRQWHTERHDTEQRLTELYVAASEQLGSDKAPVRLAGLYALSRLGQDNPAHRQTIINVICAYLRMPHIPPAPEPGVGKGRPITPRPGLAILTTGPAAGQDAREEQQVRLTAQRLLGHHLTPDGPAFWPDIDLDLSGAVLTDLTLTACRARHADFTRAVFHGHAWFDGATFTDTAWFDGATFTDTAWFDGATFTSATSFEEATFTDRARFGGATFTGTAEFIRATFTGDAGFDKAIFTDTAWFDGATFTGTASFDKATFTGHAGFTEATFTGRAWFRRVTFTDRAWFFGAAFTGTAWFDKATFTGPARFDKATFTGDAVFDGGRVQALTDRSGDVWPAGWRVEPDPVWPDEGVLVQEDAGEESGSGPVPVSE